MEVLSNALAQREELHKKLWSIADDASGAVDGWDFKQYVLLDILNELNNDELSAGDIADKFALLNSKVWYHLAILKK